MVSQDGRKIDPRLTMADGKVMLLLLRAPGTVVWCGGTTGVGGHTLPHLRDVDLPRCEWENGCSRLPFDATHAHASVMHGVCGALVRRVRRVLSGSMDGKSSSHLSHADATDRNERTT